jgi:predicted acylesterase/phospholipase RssA
MTTKISLIMTGAVSLGSFEAGVLTELLYALDHQCRNGNQYELDVITGASAGAMTAGLVAFAIMNDYTRRSNLYRAWVDLVEIESLLNDPPSNALLSQLPIQQIADQCLAPPYTTKNRASFAPQLLRMTLTLSNLNGYDRTLRAAAGAPFVSTFFDDRKIFRLSGDADAPLGVQSPQTWQQIGQFAIASGAFPLAFPPSVLERFLLEYDDPQLITQFSPRAAFIDGGTFNNQPIGEAVKLSREADLDDFAQDRRYIFVNASVNNSMFVSEEQLKPALDMPVALVKRIADAIYNEARTSDWIRALLINDQIVWRDKFIDSLIKIVMDSTVTDTPNLIAELTALNQEIVAGTTGEPEQRDGGLSLQDRLARTRSRYKAKLDAVAGLGPVRREVLELIFFAIDQVADLDARNRINIVSIAPAHRLAGEQLDAFGGFFRKEYRQYNFRYGRQTAHELLGKQEVLGAYPQEIGAEPFQQYEIPAEWQSFPEDTLADTPRRPREQLRDLLVQRAKDLVSTIDFTGWAGIDRLVAVAAREIVGVLARRRLDTLLELSSANGSSTK